ncbi:hypothetical protein TNCT_555181 [Trichonephila clavata]|uniref:Uncharacterized protein n=1 Tax=Trichonephila clavata TaxID=2740835 RepID=A0A8X6FRS9_TRICU|nr:hypothetical protein TNCT_555181 [Trichonephila clavata]
MEDHSKKSSRKKKHKGSKRKSRDPSEKEESEDEVKETSDVPGSFKDKDSSDSSIEYVPKVKIRKTPSEPQFSVVTETVSENTTFHPNPKEIVFSISHKRSYEVKVVCFEVVHNS